MGSKIIKYSICLALAVHRLLIRPTDLLGSLPHIPCLWLDRRLHCLLCRSVSLQPRQLSVWPYTQFAVSLCCLMLKRSARRMTHSSVRAACRLHAWQYRQRRHVMRVHAHTWLGVPTAFPSAVLAICLPLLCCIPPCTPAAICHQCCQHAFVKQITRCDCHQNSTCSGYSARCKQPFAVVWIQHASVVTSKVHSVGQKKEANMRQPSHLYSCLLLGQLTSFSGIDSRSTSTSSWLLTHYCRLGLLFVYRGMTSQSS